MEPRLHPGANLITRRLDDGARLRGEATRILYGYWREKRGDRPFPRWDEIHLMDLWRVAACIGVKDVIDGGRDFLNRFWGTRITEASGIEGTGKTTTEIYGDRSESSFINFRHVVETHEPVLAYRRATFVEGREHITYEVVHLPLGPDGGPVTQIITAYDFDCDLSDILDDGRKQPT